MSTSAAFPLPAPFETCAIAGCQERGNNLHHASYRGPRAWSTIPCCKPHHEELHALHDLVRDNGVSLEAFTVRFALYPDKTRRWARRAERANADHVEAPKLDRRQLSFADLMGPNGDYWRQWANGLTPP